MLLVLLPRLGPMLRDPAQVVDIHVMPAWMDGSVLQFKLLRGLLLVGTVGLATSARVGGSAYRPETPLPRRRPRMLRPHLLCFQRLARRLSDTNMPAAMPMTRPGCWIRLRR